MASTKIGKRLQDIINILEQEGWKIISDKYETLDGELEFECNKGHRVFSTWRQQRDERYCPICNREKLKSKKMKVPPKRKGVVRVLALDQSTHLTGWCVMDGRTVIDFGAYSTPDIDEAGRINNVKMWFISMLENWVPDKVGLEDVQYQQNNGGVDTLIKLSRLQGVLQDIVYEYGLQYELCPPGIWRAHCKVLGSSRLEKKRSMMMKIKQWFDLDVTDDEADAIGICKYVADRATPKIDIKSWE